MLNIKSLLSQSLLALTLAATSLAAVAAPVYHVTLDTSTLGSGTAYLDLALGGFSDSATVKATLSHFTGNYGTSATHIGDSTGSVAAGDQVVLTNSGAESNDLLQQIVLGGVFGFDLSFETSGMGEVSSFAAFLYNADISDFLGPQGSLVQVDLTPGQDDVLSSVDGIGSIGVAAAGDVPEPSTLLSMVTGLGLLGFGLRRRMR